MKNQLNSEQIADRNRNELFIGLAVFLSCLALLATDRNTHNWSDFYPSDILLFLVYFTPTFILSCMLYRLFTRRNLSMKSFMLSLIIGIPAGFTLVILLFVLCS